MKKPHEIFALLSSYQELKETGLSDSRLQKLLHQGKLLRLRRGVYADPHKISELKRWELPLLNVLVYFRITPTVVFSHQSAALLNSLALVRSPDKIHVYCAPNSRGSTSGVSKHVKLTPQTQTRLTNVGAITTDIATTVIDCATVLSFREATIVADSAMRLGLIDFATLQEAMLAYSGKYSRSVHRVAESMSDKSESPGETLTRLLLDELGYTYKEQAWVSFNGTMYRADFYLPHYGVYVEYDGLIKYTDYGPAAESIMQERRREKEFLNSGARVFRTTWKDVYTNTALFKNQLSAYVARIQC